ncbi:hypothetical protein FEP72_05256 [Burkholderia multivorans]|nr:hypothetical protein [Burkholderia multivorans]MDR9011443.1 hypothetical protein [Burkholderia multivorans]
MVEAPRIAARAEQVGLGVGHLADLRRVRLAEHVEPGRTAFGDERRIVAGHEVAVVAAAHRQRQPGHSRAEILHEIRDTRERCVGACRGRGGRTRARGIVILQHDRVDRAVDGLGLADGRVEQFERACLAFAHECREADRVVREIVVMHRGHPRCDVWRWTKHNAGPARGGAGPRRAGLTGARRGTSACGRARAPMRAAGTTRAPGS